MSDLFQNPPLIVVKCCHVTLSAGISQRGQCLFCSLNLPCVSKLEGSNKKNSEFLPGLIFIQDQPIVYWILKKQLSFVVPPNM